MKAKKQKEEIIINKNISIRPSGFTGQLPPPIIELGNEVMSAFYYYDLSGQICVEIDGEQIFFMDSGKMHHQIADLRQAITQKEKELKSIKEALSIMEKGLEVAKKTIKDNKKTSSKPSKKTTPVKHHRDDCYCNLCYAESYH